MACEESQAVTVALRKLGIEAWSCDLLEPSGNHPEWHIQADAIEVANQPGWDMVLAFPPCTHLSNSGARWFKQKREDGRQQQGIDFFMEFTKLSTLFVAIENPVGIMSTVYRKPDQIIQPWMFGHGETKATCLWLKGLPLLEPTNIVEGRKPRIHHIGPSKDRSKLRSKTYEGIADAMAEQWGRKMRSSI